MVRYLCEFCGLFFDEPYRKETSEWIDGHRRIDREELCPGCGNYLFYPADLCPKCAHPKYTDDILCGACRRELREKFCAFADELTAEEETQLDSWLSMYSVSERRDLS